MRLKGGDPFVFGRGGEEALVLREAGIPFEVVPGITAGIAAPAYAGIPVTHRELACGVAFVTGHEDPASPRPRSTGPRWPRFPGTLVFYMGVRALPRIAERLSPAGRPADEPVAVVERGTLPGQRTLLATLADVAERAAAEGIRAPAITLVGAGRRAARAARLARGAPAARPHASPSRARARRRARWPRGCASSAPRSSRRRRSASSRCEADAAGLVGYDLLCVTSPNGAERLLDHLRDARDARRRARSRRSAPAPRARCARAGSSPTSCPSAPSPRVSSRRWPTCRSRAR